MRFDLRVILFALTASPVHAIELNSWIAISGSVRGPSGAAQPHASLQLCPMTRHPLHIAPNPGGCLEVNSVNLR